MYVCVRTCIKLHIQSKQIDPKVNLDDTFVVPLKSISFLFRSGFGRKLFLDITYRPSKPYGRLIVTYKESQLCSNWIKESLTWRRQDYNRVILNNSETKTTYQDHVLTSLVGRQVGGYGFHITVIVTEDVESCTVT